MCTNNSYILQTLFKAILELKEHPEAKECIEYVNDFLNNINNEEILKQCSISWDNKNIGFLLVWDVVLPKYLFKADMIICKDYYHYHFIIRDREGKFLAMGFLAKLLTSMVLTGIPANMDIIKRNHFGRI